MKKFWVLIKETIVEGRRDHLSVFAAGFSYFLLFSILPIAIVVVAVAGKIVEAGVAKNVFVNQLAVLFDKDVAGSFGTLVSSATDIRLSHAGFLGAAFILYGASRIFSVLTQAMGRIWDKEDKRRSGFRAAMYARLSSALLMMLPVILVLLCFMMDMFLSAFKQTFHSYATGPGLRYALPAITHIFALFLYASVFACINKLLPVKKPSWKDVWLGAAVTTVVFSSTKFLFAAIFHVGRISAHFGAGGSLILVLIWIYFSMLVFFYGSEFTRIYARKFGSLSTTPSAN